jgi:cyclohexadienyl dehydratase
MTKVLARNHRTSVRARWLFLGLMFVALRAVAEPQFARDSELIDRVIELIDRRLALMPEVAAIKFQQQKPIADPERERVVLEQSIDDARAMHLDPEAARVFLSLQIRMARAVQERHFEDWREGARPPAARDLVQQLRPELDALGRELLPAVYVASTALTEMSAVALHTRMSRLRRHAGATDDILTDLAEALGALRITAPATLASLKRVGVLRVGTTGDYAPFSEDRVGALHGLDIELAQRLANSWSISVVFVRTSWPTLMNDLSRRRFDLAASGISITPERRRLADFSTPYHFDGKTPIARRENAARFSSLAAIDQPGVRVIVNPGGTVREHNQTCCDPDPSRQPDNFRGDRCSPRRFDDY